MHNGEAKTITVKVAQLPNEQVASTGGSGEESQGRIGLALAPLSPELSDQLDVPKDTQRRGGARGAAWLAGRAGRPAGGRRHRGRRRQAG